MHLLKGGGVRYHPLKTDMLQAPSGGVTAAAPEGVALACPSAQPN
jgi:hypothetical protein